MALAAGPDKTVSTGLAAASVGIFGVGPGGRTGLEQTYRTLGSKVRGGETAARYHDSQRPRKILLVQTVLQVLQISRRHGLDIGIGGGGRHALELADFPGGFAENHGQHSHHDKQEREDAKGCQAGYK